MKTQTQTIKIVSVTVEQNRDNIVLMAEDGCLITEYCKIEDSDYWIDIENVGDVNIYDLGQNGKVCTMYPELGNYQNFYNARLIIK